MNEQFIFAVRVCAAFTALLVGLILLNEGIYRIRRRQFDLALVLVTGMAGLAIGCASAFSWGVFYNFLKIVHRPAEWMINSSFIPCYTALMFISAGFLIHALSVAVNKTIFCLLSILLSGLFAYLWIGFYI